MKLVLIGAPGSGKGTQAELLAHATGARHVATGDLLRAEVRQRTELGRRVAGYLDSGSLVPDEVLLELVRPLLQMDPPATDYILDGFPRSVAQATSLDEFAGPAARTFQAVFLDVGRAELVARLLGRAAEQGRSDDTEEVIVHRLQLFDSETSPLVDYYRQSGRLVVVSGDGPVEQVRAALASVVTP